MIQGALNLNVSLRLKLEKLMIAMATIGHPLTIDELSSDGRRARLNFLGPKTPWFAVEGLADVIGLGNGDRWFWLKHE